MFYKSIFIIALQYLMVVQMEQNHLVNVNGVRIGVFCLSLLTSQLHEESETL